MKRFASNRDRVAMNDPTRARLYFVWATMIVMTSSLLMTSGCGPNEPKEVSKETSKFRVADDNEAAKPSTERTGANVSLSDNSKPAVTDAGAANERPSVIGDNVKEERLYMTLTKPEKADAKALVKFLADTDSAFAELIRDLQLGRASRQLFMDKARELAQMKLEGAESLTAIAPGPIEKDAAILGKLQALSQLNYLEEPTALPRLREQAELISTISNSAAAHDAWLTILELRISDFESGQDKDPAKLIAALEAALKEKKELGVTDMQISIQALQLAMTSNDKDFIDVVRKRIVEGFSDHPEFQLASTAWKISVSDSKELNNLIEFLQSTSSGEAPKISADEFKTLAEEFFQKFPNQYTLAFLYGEIVNIEYSGAVAHSLALADVVRSHVDVAKEPELKDEIDKALVAHKTRTDSLGKPFAMDGLVTMDGLPFDWSKYKGKVVLVDFWATWCGPCVREIPNMKTVYQEYHDKGFEIVGINLDNSQEEVKMFFQTEQLPWTTVRSGDPSKVAFDAPIAKNFGVVAIPCMVLVDKDGNVAALHSRGPKLEEKVREMLAL